MDRSEAVERCRQLGLTRDLKPEEYFELSEVERDLWDRSRTFRSRDEVPEELYERVEQRARRIARARRVADTHGDSL